LIRASSKSAIAALVAGAVLWSTVAAAQDPPRPWAEGVPEDRQKVALQLYQEGNTLFEESQPAAALTKYREALSAWDHPAIRHNVAAALILLDQPVAAYESLQLALRYGDAPFAADAYQQALTYQKLLRGQLAHLDVACAEPGADVTLDGKALFRGPGRADRWLLPGAHQLVAGKPGFLPEMRSLTLVAGKATSERLAPREIRPVALETRRRWAPWKPWVVVGAGALVALAATPFMLAARRDFETFDAAAADPQKCPASTGCDESSLPPEALEAERRGQRENAIALTMFSVGAAAALTGAVLMVLNQPRAILPEGAARVSLAPVVGRDAVGLSLSLR
jgi:hypothetical protein